MPPLFLPVVNPRTNPHEGGVILHILVTNDDGIYSSGIKALADAAIRRGHKVTVTGPSNQ